VSGGYHRRTYGNLAVTDNLNLSADDWTPFTITAPLDDRLPSGGGFPITMYTLNTNKVGAATDNLRTFSTKNARVYNGVDVNVNARIGQTAFLLGGVTHERAVSTTCDQRDNPNSLRFCDSAGPFRTLFKLAGSYELPYAVQISGSFIARPGASISANYTVTSALAGRTIVGSTAGAAQIAVNLIEPNTMFYDYINQGGSAGGADLPIREVPLAGSRRYLQSAERRHGDDAEYDVWLDPGDARVAQSADDSDEPLRPLRRATELLRACGLGLADLLHR
jgi:hypothetical protein